MAAPHLRGRILYAVVAHGRTVLAEYTAASGNFPTVTRVLLGKIPGVDNKMSYVYDSYVFHYVVEDSLIFLCLADDDLKARVAFAFLQDIKQRFQASYSPEAAYSALPLAVNNEFSRVLRRQIDFFSGSGSASNGALHYPGRSSVGVAIENVEKLLQRGEKIELLVDSPLQRSRHGYGNVSPEPHASSFKSVDPLLQRGKERLRWRRLKLCLVFLMVLIVVLVIVAMTACGGLTFAACSEPGL